MALANERGRNADYDSIWETWTALRPPYEGLCDYTSTTDSDIDREGKVDNPHLRDIEV